MVEDSLHNVTVALTVQQQLPAPVETWLHFIIIIVLVVVFAIVVVDNFGIITAVLSVIRLVFYRYRILKFFLYLFRRLGLVMRNLLSTGLAVALKNGR